MLGIVKKNSEIPNSTTSLNVGNKNNAQDSKNPSTKTELDPKELHAPSFGFHNPIKATNFGFKNIDNSFDFSQNPEIKKILKKFNISENSSNKALLDKEGQRLMIVSNGPTAFRELFNNVLRDPNSIFNPHMIDNIFKGQDMGRSNSERLFALTMFELWRNEYNVSF